MVYLSIRILAQRSAIIVGMKPTTYHFTVILADIHEMTEDLAKALFEAGCDDGSPRSSNGVATIDFDRETESIEHAVRSAVANVQKAGCHVAGVKIEAKDYLWQ